MGMGFMEAAERASAIMNNPFEPARVEAFNVQASVRDGRQTASIDGITAQERFVKAGETAHLTVNLKPYKSDKLIAVPFDVELPASLPPGQTLNVTASDAFTSRMLDRMANPGAYKPETLDQLIGLIEREEDNRDLILRVTMPSSGVSLHGETLSDLPPSLVTILAFGNQSSAGQAANQIIRKQRTEWALSGSQNLSLIVEQEK